MICGCIPPEIQAMNDHIFPDESSVRAALSALYSDPVLIETAVQRIASAGLLAHSGSRRESAAMNAANTEEIRQDLDLDLERPSRCGFPEVIFGEGKSQETVLAAIELQKRSRQDSFVTRVSEELGSAIQHEYPDAILNRLARTARIHVSGSEPRSGSSVFVVTAGTSDRPVAEEALETLRWMKIPCELIQDIGVAGPHRLQKHVPALQRAGVIVCVAGMEAALPSVVGGYVSCPVIGVPTSVGYGASLNGITALLSMVTCCASNVVCVNIDAGFKGGYVAGIIASRSGS